MRLTIREQPLIKSTAYTLVCLVLLLFSYSFLPVLRITDHSPCLLVAAVSSLALFENIKYTSFFALIFSVIETLMLGTNTLLFPLFYTAFAILCTWLFENFFVKNFFAWLCYTAGGILIHTVLSLFGPVANWDITAADILLSHAIPEFFLSAILSLPIFPLFEKLKKKTDKK